MQHLADGYGERQARLRAADGDRLPVPLLGRDERTLVFRWVSFFVIPIIRALFRPVVTGLEHVPAEGGYILCANQSSNLDGFALTYALRPLQPCWMAKSEIFNPVTRGFLRRMGIFPVRRGAADARAVAAAIELASNGIVVGIFPEGTRRRKGLNKRRTARPHSGAARVALGAQVPIVPAAIRGTERVTAFRRWHVAFGTPIRPDDLPERARPRDLTARVWGAILELESALWQSRS
jgi:1-acyl-sn-glycerol-3-phosphate acyltransferase